MRNGNIKLLVAFLLLCLNAVSQEPPYTASDMGHLALGQSRAYAISVLHQAPTAGCSGIWSLEKPVWGLEVLEFSQGRIVKMSGYCLNLGNGRGTIVRGDSINDVRERLPEPSRMKGDQINGDIEWDLEEQIFLLEMDRERATNWTMGTQILILSVREGVVEKIVLSGDCSSHS